MSIVWSIRNSEIQGVGVFVDRDIQENSIIDIGITKFLYIVPVITFFGSKINHSNNPNTYLGLYKDGKYYVISRSFIPKGTEITIDYKKTPWFVQKPNKDWK